MTDRIWIELELPPHLTDGDRKKIGEARAAKACAMLVRLGVEAKPVPVFWSEKEGRYCFTIDASGGYVIAQDNGHWYSLDYLGREGE